MRTLIYFIALSEAKFISNAKLFVSHAFQLSDPFLDVLQFQINRRPGTKTSLLLGGHLLQFSGARQRPLFPNFEHVFLVVDLLLFLELLQLLLFTLPSFILDLLELLDPVHCVFGAGQDWGLAAVAPGMSHCCDALAPEQLGVLELEQRGTTGRFNVVRAPQEVRLVLLFLSFDVFQLLSLHSQAALFLVDHLLLLFS